MTEKTIEKVLGVLCIIVASVCYTVMYTSPPEHVLLDDLGRCLTGLTALGVVLLILGYLREIVGYVARLYRDGA